MESIALITVYLKRDAIRNSFENLEPFLNIKQQDGIYYHRIIIILKMLFSLQAFESTSPNSILWLIVSIINAFFISKCPIAAAFPAAMQCFLFIISKTKFALYSSMALLCIISMNIKSYEFILDLFSIISIIIYASQTYYNELQKLWTVVYTMFAIGWYVSNLNIFSLRQFGLIACFLLLSYIPLKPDKRNKYKHRFLYFYVLMFVWIVYKFQSINLRETQTAIVNVEFQKKWGYCEGSELANSVQRGKTAETLWNEKVMNWKERTNEDDDLSKEMEENLIRTEQEIKSLKIKDEEKRHFFSLKTIEKATRLKNDPDKASLLNQEFVYQGNLDSDQKDETENKDRMKDIVTAKRIDEIVLEDKEMKVYKPITESKKMILINNRRTTKMMTNDKKLIEHQESAVYDPFKSFKCEKGKLIKKERLILNRNNLKREQNTGITETTAQRRIFKDDLNSPEFEIIQSFTGDNMRLNNEKRKNLKPSTIKTQFKGESQQFESDIQKNRDESITVGKENFRNNVFENDIFKSVYLNKLNLLERHKRSKEGVNRNQLELNALENSNIVANPEIYTLDSLIKAIRDPRSYSQRNSRRIGNTKHTSNMGRYHKNLKYMVDRKLKAKHQYIENMKKKKNWNPNKYVLKDKKNSVI